MDGRVVRCNHLIKKIQRGNKKALDELFSEFGALFLNMAKKYLYDKSNAEDLLSDVFLTIIRTGARSFDENKNGLNWIFTIIRREAYKLNGKNNLAGGLDEEKSLARFIPDDFLSDEFIDNLTLRHALETLTGWENELIYYKFWEGLTVREIATKLNKPRSTVQYDIDKAMKKIKKFWKNGE